MFNKKLWTNIKTYVGMLLLAVAVFASPAVTLVCAAAESTDIEVCADIKEWLYKIEDGKMYKRLYNRSTGLWETDWIYLCDYPEGI